MKVLRPVFWLTVVFTMVMALLPQPPAVLEVNDKLQHMAAFAALTLLAAVSFPKLRYRYIFVAMAALGAAIEVLQMIPSLDRDAQVSDWLADLRGHHSCLALLRGHALVASQGCSLAAPFTAP